MRLFLLETTIFTFLLTKFAYGSREIFENFVNETTWTEEEKEKALEVLMEWSNDPGCMKKDELFAYYTEATFEYKVEENDEYYESIEKTGSAISAMFGLVGSIMCLLIMFAPGNRAQFSHSSFVYLKIVAVAEMMEKLVVISNEFYKHILIGVVGRQIYVYELLNFWTRPVSRCLMFFIDVITLGMSLDRAACLLSPTLLYLTLQKRSFVGGVCFAASLVLLLYLPTLCRYGAIQYDENGDCCIEEDNPSWLELTMEDVTDLTWLLVTFAIFICSVLVIIGLARVQKNRNKVLSRRGSEAKEAERKRNHRLSVMLLGLSIPLVVYGSLRIPDGLFSRYLLLLEDAVAKICLRQARAHLRFATISFIIDVFQDVSTRLAHDSNFYLYILLMPAFRRGLLSISKGKQVHPTEAAKSTKRKSTTANRPAE